MAWPRSRADCALSNLVEEGGRSRCYGAGVQHAAHCPVCRSACRLAPFWRDVVLGWLAGLLWTMRRPGWWTRRAMGGGR